MPTKTALALLVALFLGWAPAQAQPATLADPPPVTEGATVHIEYTLTDDAGTVLDSNAGREALIYTPGEQQIVPGLERALMGMRAGEEKQVVVQPDDGYGPVDPGAESEVPKELLPPDALTVGTRLVAKSPDGATRLVRVKEVRERTVLIDFNHPLAGVTLHFAIKILDVEPPPPK